VKTTAAEVEPLISEVARKWFGMPAEVRVIPEDARTWLNRCPEKYDLVFLDAYVGENTPWYLNTREAMQDMKRVLNPGGRLLVNIVTRSQGSPGQERLEANLLDSFGEALVFSEDPDPGDTSDLVNATFVAGTDLKASDEKFPSVVMKRFEPKLLALFNHRRPAHAGARIMTDDDCDLDYAESELRTEWRRLIFSQMGPSVLAD
jgi:SAM-dependent methyltransferase